MTGIGDLVVTCSSLGSRNHYVGRELGKGQPLATILAGLQMVAEVVSSTPAVLDVSPIDSLDGSLVFVSPVAAAMTTWPLITRSPG